MKNSINSFAEICPWFFCNVKADLRGKTFAYNYRMQSAYHPYNTATTVVKF